MGPRRMKEQEIETETLLLRRQETLRRDEGQERRRRGQRRGKDPQEQRQNTDLQGQR